MASGFHGFGISADTWALYHNLPQFVQDADLANGGQFLAWLEGIGSQQQIVDDLCRDDANGDVGWSVLLDVSRCPTYALPWLAQFVGTRFNSTQAGNDGLMRNAIAFERSTWARGTFPYMAEIAAPYLQAGGYLQIDERTTDAYHFTVYVSGLQGFTYAALALAYATYDDVDNAFATYDDFTQNTVALIAALESAKPAGLIMTVLFVRDYNQLDAAFATYNDLDAAFATYGAIH